MSEPVLPGPLPGQLTESARWRRLDPLMLLVHPVTELGRFLPVVVVAFLFGSQDRGHDWWQWVVLVVPVLIGLVRFLMTSYRITEGRVELRRGLLGRSVLTARLDRVRSVELTASPVHRILGLAKVRIGTGASQGGDDQLELDALRHSAAEALRTALLHRVAAGAAGHANVADGSPGNPAGPASDIRMSGYAPLVPLLRLDITWARYAPFTSAGLVIAGAIFAGLGQLSQVLPDGDEPRVRVDLSGIALAVLLVAALGFLVLLAVLSVIGYLVSYGGYVLSADSTGRTLHVTRGLLTRRETTLESQRVRGLELHEPLSLRLVGARRLYAAVTGLQRTSGGTSLLIPPAPRRIVEYVGQGVLLGDPALVMPLREHGPAARRRRHVRALVGLGIPAVLVGVLAFAVDGLWLLVPAVLLVVVAPPLAADRYRRLGHTLTSRLLVTRSGTIRGRRVVLERTGIIGWTIRQTFWQRRAGLCDLVATTSAGRQGYTVADVPVADAVALADAAVPGLVSQFQN